MPNHLICPLPPLPPGLKSSVHGRKGVVENRAARRGWRPIPLPQQLLDLPEARWESYRLERNFYRFVRAAWNLVDPTPFCDGWHIKAVCDHLQAVSEGKIRRLLINIPPRHGKSLIVSVLWPVWEWIRKPHTRWLCMSYGADLATRDAVKARLLILSAWFQNRWGDRFNLKRDVNRKTRYENDHGGFRVASSIGGLGTGEGGDRIVIDDPHKADEAQSEEQRDAVVSWWKGTMSSRENDPKSTAWVVIMQRLHEDDLAGYILKEEGEDWVHLMLPVRFDPARACVTSLPWQDPRSRAGELIWPERYGPIEEARLRRKMGSYNAAGQLDQSPAPPEGGIFKRFWFANRYNTLPKGVELDCLTTWDLNFDATPGSSYVVGLAIYFTTTEPRQYYVVDMFRERIDYADSEHAFQEFAAKHKGIRRHVIEKKANGAALISRMSRKMSGVIPWEKGKSKIVCYRAIAPLAEAGQIWLPDWGQLSPWVSDFMGEVCGVPTAAFDDIPDALAQGILYVESGLLRRRTRARRVHTARLG